MAKAVAEIGIGAVAIAAPLVLPGLGVAVTASLTTTLISMGASMAMAGAMTGLAALTANHGGVRTAAKNPIGSWGYCYGYQLVAPTEIFQESNNSQGTSNNKQLHRVFALASHPCAIGPLGTWQLRIDGKAVPFHASGNGFVSFSPVQTVINITSVSRTGGVVTIKLASALSNYNGLPALITNIRDNTFNGTWLLTQPNPADATTFTYVCGGSDGTTSGGRVKTTYPDYSNKIYVEFLNGNHTSTFQGLLQSNTSWTSSDLCLGRTMAYVRMGYDSSYFPSGVPNISFVIQGKNDIYDPRTGLKGYTNNAALCIADYLALPPAKGGFGLGIGTDIPTSQLVAAANICDESMALAAGGSQPQYMLDSFFQLNKGRGSILQELLTSCAGRLSYQGGTYEVFPGGWTAPVLALTESDIYGEMEFSHRHSIRDTCNAVKGVFTGAENNWAQADVPPYMQDAAHGYASDRWLIEDSGERIFKDANFPATSTSAGAQRLAKIDMLRVRYQVRGTIRCSMRAYQLVALDTFTLTHRRYGWQGKLFEVLSSRLVLGKSDQPTLLVELDIAEADPAIYDWSSIEQLTPQGWREPSNVNLSIVSPVEMLDVYSGMAMTSPINPLHPRPTTVMIGADGIQRSTLWCSWVSPNDPHVMSGGHIEVQWQVAGAASWSSAGKFDPSTTECWLGSVVDGQTYSVQVRAVNVAGAVSDWVGVLSTTIAAAGSTMNATAVTYSDGTPVNSLRPAQAGADVTGSNTSADTANVNGLQSTRVSNLALGSGISQHDMVVNGSFENGSTGWTLGGGIISSAQYHSGTQSLQLLNTTTTQTVNGLVAGHIYLLQMWVMTNGNVTGTYAWGAGAYGVVTAGTVTQLTTNGYHHGFASTYIDVELAATVATAWTLISCTFTPSANCSIALQVQNSVGGGSVSGTAWIDGVSLMDLTAQNTIDAVADSPTYIRQSSVGSTYSVDNGNFEASTSLVNGAPPGWKVGGAGIATATCSYDTSTQYAGGQSVQVVSTTGYGGISHARAYSVTPGDQIKVSGALKSISGTQCEIIPIFWTSTPGVGQTIVGTIPTTSTTWVYLTGTVQVPAGCTVMTLVVCSGANSCTFECDNISVVRLSSLDTEVLDGPNYKRVSSTNVGASGVLQYSGGTTIDSLKPAQAGADVTGSNTAANTNNVGSVPAATVASVIPSGAKLYINAGTKSYSIIASN